MLVCSRELEFRLTAPAVAWMWVFSRFLHICLLSSALCVLVPKLFSLEHRLRALTPAAGHSQACKRPQLSSLGLRQAQNVCLS